MMPLKLKLFTVLCIAAIFLLTATAFGQDAATDSIDTDTGEPTDAEIKARLTGIFKEIDGLETVTVESEVGVVTLGGQVLRVELAGDAEQLAESVVGVVAIQNEIRRDSRFSQQLKPLVSKIRGIFDSLIVGLPLFLLAILILAAFWWSGGVVARNLRLPKAWTPNGFVGDLIRLLVRLAIALGGFVIAAELLGATALLISVLGGLGVVGLALGFAIRDTVENFVASLLLSIRQPFGANEHVIIEGNEGRVVRLTSRATILLSLDGNHIRIPNGVVYKSTIINFSRNPMRRFQFDVGVDTDVRPQLAQELAVKTLAAIEGVLSDPAPNCVVESLGDSNVVLRNYAWINQKDSDFARTRSASMAAVKQAFEAADINMPEPIYRLRVENVDSSVVKDGVLSEELPVQEHRQEDLKPDLAIEKQVEQQRGGDDLLDQSAPRE